MSDNVNIIVQDTINEIVVNTAVVVETIDINVQVAVDEVNIIANPNNYVVNINRIIGEQVQSDWDQTDNQAPDYIKNKPTIPAAQVNSDWNATTGKAEILNKPTIPSIDGLATVVYVDQQDNLKVDKVAGKGLSENDFTNTLKTKLDGIESGAQVNVNADWNATTGDAEILNKPTIPAAQVNSDWNATSGVEEILNKPSIPTLTSDLINDGEDGVNPFITAADLPTSVTSVGLTMPSAFTVTNSPITSSGDIAVTGAGTVSQYVRGDGTLANFPNSTGGGASVNYYLNGSISQGTFGGTTYYQMSKTPILGAGTNFIRTNGAGNGYIASFITDAGDPSFLNIPGGNWNLEFYFQSSASGGSPQFYGEIYKVSATNVFTLVASGSANPEGITNGTTVDQYFTSIPMPQTSLLITDRLAIRIYVITAGRTITLHTENGNLCEVLTTFTTGLTALNGLTTQVQSFATGTSGTDFGISSATSTHTFNLPTASATNRGALSTTDWSAFNGKFNLPSLTSGSVLFSNGTTIAQDNAQLFWDDTNNRLGIGTATPGYGVSHIGSIGVASFFSQRDFGANALSQLTQRASYIGYTFNDGTNGIATGANGTGAYIQGFTGTLANPSAKQIVLQTFGGNVGVGINPQARLDVRAQGALSTDIALRVRNSADSGDLFQVQGNGAIVLSSGASFYTLGNNLNFRSNLAGGSGFVIDAQSFHTLNSTNNEQGFGFFSGTFAPTSGTGTLNGLKITPTINQTGGANGITRGLYINPTITAAADFRAIETTVGNVILGSTSGNVGIGTTTVGERLVVSGNAAISGRMHIGGTTAFGNPIVLGVTGQSYLNGNVGIGTTAPAARLDVRAQGALSTDIAFRVRNSADTLNLVTVDGLGTLIGKGFQGTFFYAGTTYYDNARIYIGSTNNAKFQTFTSGFSIEQGAVTTIAPTAIFELKSTTQGFLPPRMTNAQRIAIATPAVGLCVYCTDVVEGLYINKSTGWTYIG